MTAVVSVTPVLLSSDSRTLKQVRTLDALGFQSTAIAAGRVVPATELRGPGQPTTISETTDAETSTDSLPRRLWALARSGKITIVGEAIAFLVWLLVVLLPRNLRVLVRLGRADLYILHEPSQYPAVALASRWYHAPFVYDAHDFYSGIEPVADLPSLDRRFIRPALLAIERQCVSRAAAVMTVSDGLADLIEERFGRRPAVVRNVHDGAHDRPLADHEARAFRDTHGIPDTAFLLATAGNCKPGQEFGGLLSAMAATADVHLMLIGGGYNRVTAEAVALSVGDRVHDLGRLAPGSVVPLLRLADAAAITYVARSANYDSALPNGFFQSIAAGLPLLYPPLSEILRLARAHDLGIEIDPSQAVSWTAAIARLTETDAAIGMYRENTTVAARELDWSREATRFMAVVDDVLSHPRSGSTN